MENAFSVTNTTSLATAVYTAWGYSPTGWETNELATFSQGFGETVYTNASSQGATHVKAFCDLNGNGEYDADNDMLLVRTIPYGGSAKVDFKFGDVDDDGFSDALERNEGTDPFDAGSYCFNLSQTYTGVFQTTNALTFAAYFGTNRVHGPCVVADRVWTHDFGHCLATSGEKASVSVWDDANQNGECDAGETSNRYEIAVIGHDMALTNALTYGKFDRDGNTLPDWWESLEGLDADGVARRAYDDPDGDGLINLHEFWSGTHPLVPDGSNTLLSVASRSIDDRIRDIDPATSIPRFVNYFVNGINGIFQLNTNFWARDLDLSCVSVWHNGDYPGSKAATLITRKHVVLASHWYNLGTYTFCDANGLVCERNLARTEWISDDLRLGFLNEPLPGSFKPARIPSTNIVHYLATGKYLPTLCLNHEKGGSVSELVALDCETISDRGIHYQHYGCTSQTNLVSVQRCSVRGATVDGTSGCPVFVVVGNELVLLFSKHLGQKNGETWQRYWGPMLPFRLDAIQHKIDQWEGDGASQYQIETLDLSSFGEIVNQP